MTPRVIATGGTAELSAATADDEADDGELLTIDELIRESPSNRFWVYGAMGAVVVWPSSSGSARSDRVDNYDSIPHATSSGRPLELNTPNLATRRRTRKSTFRHYDISQGYPSEMSFYKSFVGGTCTRVGVATPHAALKVLSSPDG